MVRIHIVELHINKQNNNRNKHNNINQNIQNIYNRHNLKHQHQHKVVINSRMTMIMNKDRKCRELCRHRSCSQK